MTKKMVILFACFIVALTSVFLIIGNALEKPENERKRGIGEVFTLSSTNRLAYVLYEEGEPNLYVADEDGKNAKKIDTISNLYTIEHLAFSPDSNKIVYSIFEKKIESQQSQIFEYDLQTNKRTTLFENATNISDPFYSSDNTSLIYVEFIRNEDPNLSNYQINMYNPDTKDKTPFTNLKSNNYIPIQISKDGKTLYYKLGGDSNSFEERPMKQQIYQLSLQEPEKITKIPTPETEILDFSFSTNGEEMIFTSIANIETNDTFEYELFSWNTKTQEEKQITHFEDSVSQPYFSNNESRIYFIHYENWPDKNNPNYIIKYKDRTTVKFHTIQLVNELK